MKIQAGLEPRYIDKLIEAYLLMNGEN